MKLLKYNEKIIRLHKFKLGTFMSYNCGEQSNTLNLCAFLYVLGLQDITSRLKQFSIEFDVIIWMGEEFYIMSTSEEVIRTS